MNNGTLSRKQFDVLTYLERNTQKISQRDIAEATGMSLGSVNRTMASLAQEGLADGYMITGAL